MCLFFFFYSYGDLRDLHSFPTRRSSDLDHCHALAAADAHRLDADRPVECPQVVKQRDDVRRRRSEEHTSELQSRGHLVCRLLLEKKKNTICRFTMVNTR